MLFRRIVLGLALIGAASQPALALDKLKLAIGQRGLWDSSIAEAGDKLGIFKKHGLEIEAFYTSSGGETLQVVISGSSHIGISAGTLGRARRLLERRAAAHHWRRGDRHRRILFRARGIADQEMVGRHRQ